MLLPAIGARAQPPPKKLGTLDSLQQVEARQTADTLGSRALAGWLSYYLYRDTAQAHAYGRRALELATRLHDTTRLAKIEYNLGTLAGL